MNSWDIRYNTIASPTAGDLRTVNHVHDLLHASQHHDTALLSHIGYRALSGVVPLHAGWCGQCLIKLPHQGLHQGLHQLGTPPGHTTILDWVSAALAVDS